MFVRNAQHNFSSNICFKKTNLSSESIGTGETPADASKIKSIPSDTLELFYVNDWHRKLTPLYALSKKIEEFDNEKTDADKLKIAAGDLVVGENKRINKFFFKFFSNNGKNNNKPAGLGFDVMCLGNHEFDVYEDGLAEELDDKKFPTYPFVATNLTIKDKSPLVRHRDKKIVKSYVKEINGTKYGFVGLVPTTLNGGKYSATFFPGLYISDQRVDEENKDMLNSDNPRTAYFILKSDIFDLINKLDIISGKKKINKQIFELEQIYYQINKIQDNIKDKPDFKVQDLKLKRIKQMLETENKLLKEKAPDNDKKQQIDKIIKNLREELYSLHRLNKQKLTEVSLTETVETLNDEIAKLEEQNINRIICISHMGPKENLIIAEKVRGIDIIVSGHKHKLFFEPILIKSKKTASKEKIKEPTLILQAGRNGEFYGKLKVKFDANGIMDMSSIENEIQPNLVKSIYIEFKKFYEDVEIQIYGKKSHELGYLTKSYEPVKNKIEENPVVSFIADAIKYKTNSDIVMLLNQYDFTNFKLGSGTVSERDIDDLLTYDDKLYKLKMTGSEIIQLLNWGRDSLKNNSKLQNTGTAQVSGLRYSISPKMVKNIFITSDKEENEISFNKTYEVIIDEYMVNRANDETESYIAKFLKFKKPEVLPFRTKSAVIEYMRENKNLFKQFSFEPSGRINVVDYKIKSKSKSSD